jgi:hypothetical protein
LLTAHAADRADETGTTIMPELTGAQRTGLDKVGRAYNFESGDTLSRLIQEDILDPIDNSPLGATASAAEIDAAAAGVGFVPGTHAGLNFVYGAGRLNLGYSSVTVSGGSVALSASATNYIEVDRAGTVSANTTAFTAGRYALWVVATSGVAVATTTRAQPDGTLLGDNAVNGLMLSTPGATKEVLVPVGLVPTAAGTVYFTATVPKSIAAASVITAASFVSRTALAANNTNYVTWTITNRNSDGTGTQVLVDGTAAANSTKVTGGSAIVAKGRRDLTLVTVSGGAERDVVGGDVLEIAITGTGTLANTLTECSLLLEFGFEN